MYDRILVPTDGSSGARRAIDHGIDLARHFDATVHTIFVVDTADFGAAEPMGPAVVALESIADAAVQEVTMRASDAGVEAVTAVRTGSPHREILDYADELDIDAIVMGTHGRSGIERMLLGSVAERVVRGADVPVVTMRVVEERSTIDADRAVAVAEDALADAGVEEARPVDEPFRGIHSWIVPMEADGRRYRVHVDAGSGETSIATIPTSDGSEPNH